MLIGNRRAQEPIETEAQTAMARTLSRQPFLRLRKGLVNLNALARSDVRCWESVCRRKGARPQGARAGSIVAKKPEGGGDAAG